MVQCKRFHYRYQNVRFVFDFIRKRNVCVGIESLQKGLGFLLTEIPLNFPQELVLHQLNIKGTRFYLKVMKEKER